MNSWQQLIARLLVTWPLEDEAEDFDCAELLRTARLWRNTEKRRAARETLKNRYHLLTWIRRGRRIV